MLERFARAAALSLLFFGAVGQATAAPLDALQGAWTTGSTDCVDEFKKVGGRIEFIDRASSRTTGIIVRGSEILGSNATCTVERIRQERDRLSAYLTCVGAVMFGGMSVSFQIIDATKFKRFVPDFPEIHVNYFKCEF